MFSSDEVDTEVLHLKVFNLLPWQELSTQGGTELVFVFGFGSLWLLLTIRVFWSWSVATIQVLIFCFSLDTHNPRFLYKVQPIARLEKVSFSAEKVTK